MPETKLHYFAEEDESVPVYEWLRTLGARDKKALANCLAKIRLLAEMGHELRRPHADYLRDGVYELRAKRGRVQYRILYFFHGKNVALLLSGLIKKGNAVPAVEIDRAVMRKTQYEQEPDKHTAAIQIESFE